MTRHFKAGQFDLTLGERTLVMGIVNVTPDSFSDGGLAFEQEAAIARGLQLASEGADILDVGGESTRPGSEPVPAGEELRRVLAVIEALAGEVSIPVSIDTCKSSVAREAIKVGASIVNDISAGTFDSDMARVVADSTAGVVLMHIQGTPRDMQKNPRYNDVVREVGDYLKGATVRFEQSGVARERIMVDPGIGFGKLLEHNLLLLKNLTALQGIAAGVLLGVSRKSFIGLLTGRPVGERTNGTLATISSLAGRGADVVRVHDVAATVEALKIADAIRSGHAVWPVAG
ncbi:MAG: dihydropteroate synthase [Calditrichaeota bacterium]|nr:dihydropteroate synthase [Calditrichota bacterium]